MSISSWPCKPGALEAAQRFLRSTLQSRRVLLVPDRDADGLCAGSILHRTLTLLGHRDVQVHILGKGQNIHEEGAAAAMRDCHPEYLVVLDQGSRGGGALLPGTPTLIIDHHQSQEFPDKAQVLSSYGCEPVATTSMLAYLACQPLHADVASACSWLAALGTMGDLGTSFKFTPPFPDLHPAIKAGGGRKAFAAAVSNINAPRRTAACNTQLAWDALAAAEGARDLDPGSPSFVPQAAALRGCREEVSAAVNAAARAPPWFSADGRMALIKISSPAQIHPLIVTRWSRTLKGKNLQVVICCNDGYLPGRVNFAARGAQQGGGTVAAGGRIDLIQVLKEATLHEEGLAEELGENFARGHAQATGGSVTPAAFQRLLNVLGFTAEAHSRLGLSGHKRGLGRGAAPQEQKRTKTLLHFGFKRDIGAER